MILIAVTGPQTAAESDTTTLSQHALQLRVQKLFLAQACC